VSNRGGELEQSGTHSSIGQFEHVVFMGTFNADSFKPQIEGWLRELDLAGVGLFVADNQSTDNTLAWMRELIADLNCFSDIAVNDKNYGGYGNLAINLHRFETAKWVTTLHQDDCYSVSHIQNHRKVISNSGTGLGMVCSEAISVSPNGRRLGYPRAQWLLEDNTDPITVFLANLRNHAFPFSGATFSKDVLLNYPIPWHSTAFPDTEIVMKMAVDYKTKFASDATVYYLENPSSESHSLTSQDRDFGAFQALLRVFAHPNYKVLCELLSKDETPNFLKALDEGISLRFLDPTYRNLMRQAAHEITAQHIGTSHTMADYLVEGYLRVGDVRAIETLRALGASFPTQVAADQEVNIPLASFAKPAQKFEWAATLGAFLPRSLRRRLFRALMATKVGKTVFASWDFDWRKN